MLIWQGVNSKSLQNGTLEQMLIIYVTDSGKNPKHRICINYTVIHQHDHSCICSMISIQKLFWKIMETKTRKKLNALDFVSKDRWVSVPKIGISPKIRMFYLY